MKVDIVRRIEVAISTPGKAGLDTVSVLFTSEGPVHVVRQGGWTPDVVEVFEKLARVAWELGREAGKAEASK